MVECQPGCLLRYQNLQNTLNEQRVTYFKMRILHITAKMDPTMGGISQGIRTMIDGLLELGAENEVVTLDEPDASFLKDEEFIINTPGKGKGHGVLIPVLHRGSGKT